MEIEADEIIGGWRVWRFWDRVGGEMEKDGEV